jgi:hypothetical protein
MVRALLLVLHVLAGRGVAPTPESWTATAEIVAGEYRAWLRTLLTDLAEAAGANDAERFGRQLALLYDGAAVAARMDRDRAGAAKALRSAAVALLDSAIAHYR